MFYINICWHNVLSTYMFKDHTTIYEKKNFSYLMWNFFQWNKVLRMYAVNWWIYRELHFDITFKQEWIFGKLQRHIKILEMIDIVCEFCSECVKLMFRNCWPPREKKVGSVKDWESKTTRKHLRSYREAKNCFPKCCFKSWKSINFFCLKDTGMFSGILGNSE